MKDTEDNEIRVNLSIDKQTNPLFFEFLRDFPKRKRATIIRNIIEQHLKDKK